MWRRQKVRNYLAPCSDWARENERTLRQVGNNIRQQCVVANSHRAGRQLRCTRIDVRPGPRKIADAGIVDGIRRARTFRSRHRDFVRRLGRKLARRIRLRRIALHGRDFRTRISRWILLRRFGRNARRRRWNLRWLAHAGSWVLRHIATFRFSPMPGRLLSAAIVVSLMNRSTCSAEATSRGKLCSVADSADIAGSAY